MLFSYYTKFIGWVLFNTGADKGFAPLLTGHEPAMLLLHQSALIFNQINIIYKLQLTQCN